jgi:hypothetical protein
MWMLERQVVEGSLWFLPKGWRRYVHDYEREIVKDFRVGRMKRSTGVDCDLCLGRLSELRGEVEWWYFLAEKV